MQQGSDYGYYSQHYPPYNPNPNPNPGEYPPSNPTYASASAPPYSQYGGPDLPSYPSSYPPYSQTLDPVPNLPPSAPSYSQPPPQAQPQPQPQPEAPPQHPPFEQYNASSYSAEPVASAYSHPQQSYYLHDSHQPAGGYGSGPNSNPSPNPNPNPNPSFNTNPIPNPSPSFSSPYPSYAKPYESVTQRFDHGGGYLGDNPSQYGAGMTGSYGRSSSGFDQDFYERRPDSGYQYDHASIQDDVLGAGVYRYDGGGAEPYGARGTGGTARSSSSSWSAFDDYGRSTSFSSAGKDQDSGGMGKIVRAVPKAETQQDVKSGVLKFRVKLLAEGSGHSTIDVLCQIGLDGIRMLDPSTSRTLRIYPLETVTRWEVSDPSIYTFWSKSSVDIDPRRIRLQSNRYTTSTILDTVAAATVQLKEMGVKESLARSKVPSDSGKQSEQSNEKKKGFEWMNFIKPGNEEKDHWVPDEAVTKCTSCGVDFNAFVRKHHCRNCGDIFCDKCTHGRIALTAEENAQPVRVCDRCMAEVTQRLNNAKEAASRSAAVHSHEDLARRLQEEMDRNRKTSAGSKSTDASGRRMREVACPTCTVHLQVQVPTSGSETIECGVCQHPFLVSAH